MLQLDAERIAFVLESPSRATDVFAVEELHDEQIRETARAFVDETDFDSEVLLQLEEEVPNTNTGVSVSEYRLQKSNFVVEYEEVENESVSGGAPAVSENGLLFRVDVETGGVDSFELVTRGIEGDISFSPSSVSSLSE